MIAGTCFIKDCGNPDYDHGWCKHHCDEWVQCGHPLGPAFMQSQRNPSPHPPPPPPSPSDRLPPPPPPVSSGPSGHQVPIQKIVAGKTAGQILRETATRASMGVSRGQFGVIDSNALGHGLRNEYPEEAMAIALRASPNGGVTWLPNAGDFVMGALLEMQEAYPEIVNRPWWPSSDTRINWWQVVNIIWGVPHPYSHSTGWVSHTPDGRL